MRRIRLRKNETKAQYDRRKAFEDDCMAVHQFVRQNPGVPSRIEIGQYLGLDVKRVANCIYAINHGDTGQHRMDYGWAQPKGGRYASKEQVRGWFVMDRASYHPVMTQADKHGGRVQYTVWRGRVVRLLGARGMPGAAAAQAAADIMDRLDLDPATMTQTDWDALEELILEENGV